MAKTPFPFKSTGKTAHENPETVRLIGSTEVLAMYSDTFMLLNESDTGMASLYFYQRQMDDRATHFGTSQGANLFSGAKCVARIVMSPVAIEKLLTGLAENRGFTLTPKTKEEKK